MTLKSKEVEVLWKCVCGRSKFIGQVVAQPTVWLTVAVVSKLYPILLHSMACSLPGSSMGFLQQEYWSGCHFPFQGIFPTQGSDMPLPLSHQGSPFGLLDHPTYTLLLQSPTMYLFSNSLHFACIFWKITIWMGLIYGQESFKSSKISTIAKRVVHIFIYTMIDENSIKINQPSNWSLQVVLYPWVNFY